MKLYEYERNGAWMTWRGYIPALILLAMLTVTFLFPWLVGWIEIIRRVWG